MSIQWFPGHMHLTRKAIAARITQIDVVLELLDARLPGSSANPLLAELTGHKPTLKLLNKQDLAEPDCTAQWLDWYRARHATGAIALDAHAAGPAPVQRLVAACRQLAPNRGGVAKPLRVLICGVPNVGKSTLINRLRGKRQAQTGDEAAITRREQRIALADDFHLWDTPGLLWPRIAAPESAHNLAASGAMGRNAYDEELLALALLARLRERHGALLQARYRLAPAAIDASTASATIAAMDAPALLDAIARRRGAMQSGARCDQHKAAEVLLNDLRSAALGRITLETPAQFEAWRSAGQAQDALRQTRKDARTRASAETV